MTVTEGTVRLSDRVIFGLLAVAVLSAVNSDQRVPYGYWLSMGDTQLLINDWWGRAPDFPSIATLHAMPRVKLDFGDWIDP